jgi:hypothetical protein
MELGFAEHLCACNTSLPPLIESMRRHETGGALCAPLKRPASHFAKLITLVKILAQIDAFVFFVFRPPR